MPHSTMRWKWSAPLALCAGLGVVMNGCGADSGSAEREDDSADAQQSEAARDSGRAPSDTVDAVADAGAPTTGGVSCTDMIPPTTDAITLVFQRSCGLAQACHAGNAPQAGLDLSATEGVLAAVDRASTQNPATKLIAPGKPEDSYLLRKILDSQTEGTRMPPPPNPALCEAKARAVEEWIRAGALR